MLLRITNSFLFSGNATLHLECRHKSNFTNSVKDLTIEIYLPYYFMYVSTKASQASIQPTDIIHSMSCLTVKVSLCQIINLLDTLAFSFNWKRNESIASTRSFSNRFTRRHENDTGDWKHYQPYCACLESFLVSHDQSFSKVCVFSGELTRPYDTDTVAFSNLSTFQFTFSSKTTNRVDGA